MPRRFALYLGLLLSLYLFYILWRPDEALFTDFGKFHASAQLYWEGESIYKEPELERFVRWQWEWGPAPEMLYPNLNPPFVTLLLLPFGFVEYSTGWWIWSLLSLLAGLAAMLRLEAGTREGPPQRTRAYLFLLALLAYYPTFATIQFGQVSLFLLFPTVEAWLAARRRKDIQAGIWLGLVLAIKPFFGLFGLLFLVLRRLKTVIAMGLMFVFCTGLSVLVFGLDTFRLYQALVGEITWTGTNWNASFLGIGTRLLGGADTAPLIHLPQIAKAMASLASVVSAALLVIAVWPEVSSRLQERQRLDRAFASAVALMLLISPLGWAYYFPLLLPAYYIAWTQVGSEKPPGLNLGSNTLLLMSLALSALPIPLMSQLHEQPAWHWYIWSSVHSISLLLLSFVLLKVTWLRRSPGLDRAVTDADLVGS